MIEKPLIPPPNWSKFEPLRKQRVELGFSRGEVAAAMAAGYNHISRIENGGDLITDAFIRRYADALDRLTNARGEREQAQADKT